MDFGNKQDNFQKMNTTVFRNYILLLALIFCCFSCRKEQKTKGQKKTFFNPPITIIASNPIVTLSDTCPKPNIVIVPTKNSVSYIDQIKKEQQTLKFFPAVTSVQTAGEAGGFNSMQNYTTNDGLALDLLSSSCTDHFGNLWFGTYGGGVSRYDGKSFTNFTISQGLVNNSISCIVEDKKGNIWFGSFDGGVSRYDGKFFTNFTISQGLADNKIRCIMEDKTGNIWLGTNGSGVSRYDGKSFTNYETTQGLANNIINCIIEDKLGNIWMGTEGGVSRYDTNRENPLHDERKYFRNFTTKQGLASNYIGSIQEDEMGNIWFGTFGEGVSRLDGKFQLDGRYCFTNFTTEQGLANNSIYCITEDKKGNIWFGTDGGGVSRYDGKSFTNFTTAQGLANNIVEDITEDKSGNLWFSTYGGGISRYDGKAVTNFTSVQGLANNNVFSITEDTVGNLWFGSEGGVSCYDGNKVSGQVSFTNFTTAQGLANNTIWGIKKDKKGNIWFGTNGGGVARYDGKSFTNYTTEQGLANNVVHCIMEDKMGNFWFGTEGGVSRYDGKSFTNYSTAQGLANNSIYSIVEDKKGNIWFGTYGQGVSRYNGKSFTNFTTKQGLANNNVRSIIEDKLGNLWFGTDGGGVSLYSPEAKISSGSSFFINFTIAQGLADDIIYSICEDTLNNMIWFGTNTGLSGLKVNSLLPGTDKAIFENFNNKTGYPIKDLNTNALFLDSKGIIWAGTGNKLIRFDYNAIHKNITPPTIFIQSIKINNSPICWNNLAKNLDNNKRSKDSQIPYNSLSISPNILEEVNSFGRVLSEEQRDTMAEKFSDIKFDGITEFYPLPNHLVLPFSHNNITFDFTAIEPARPYMVHYQFILEGYENEWSPLTNKTTATFGNIYEGNYTFKLKAQSPDGIWCKPVIYSFKVLPPLYRTWWAYSIYLIAVSGVLYFLYLLRTASLRKDKQILEQIVRDRTSEVVRQKNIVEEKNATITDSIEYAKNIQQAVLPAEEDIAKHFQNHFILYEPKDIVSGDFYWVYETRDRIYIAVADCTGHGVSGAFMSLMGNNLLNDTVKSNDRFGPSEILDELNIQILNTLKQNNKNIVAKFGMDIALISIDKEMTELKYAGAHNPLLIYRDGECFQIKADKSTIGLIKDPRDPGFSNHNFKLIKGDMLYMFTDGYADQFGGPEYEKFYSLTFRNLLQTICNLEMSEQKKILYETIIKWKGDQNQTDDILVVGIRV